MAGASAKAVDAVEAYFADLRQVRASGGATGERSCYPALVRLLNAVGATLKPKVYCVVELADQGAGHPDIGLYAQQARKSGHPARRIPEHGVVEVKSSGEDASGVAAGEQVSRYWVRYRRVLVTNTRDFVLVGDDGSGRPARLEALRLAESEEAFVTQLEKPRRFASERGARLAEYLCRALSYRASLAEPRDLASLLASHARDGLSRVQSAGDSLSLRVLRRALEEALGVRFEGARGVRFFHSTLVQTLFYGVFSAWVLWVRKDMAAPDGPLFNGRYRPPRFSWREAVWHFRAPVLRALFQQVSDPGRLEPLGLVEVLDWAAAALDRVDRPAFFARFREGAAVPYFYEPFLEAFDPALRKQLGVWYTPPEVVRYMVARVDRALKDDLGIAEGLAAEQVYVLDPCCGTGAYLAEVLRRIAANLNGRGSGALRFARVRKAATERVFGFEIMPAPFVVAHLQVGLTLQELGASLSADGTERAGVYLTNALSGWQPRTSEPLPFPELEEERDRAERVKRDAPILVILGNPPYNGYAGVAVEEERELTEAYRSTRHVRRPEGQGLNDLYVRFFRMAERRIAEETGRGMVCFISNYSWLDGLSFTGMRERYMEMFDAIRIDCLNGDKYRTGKVAPDGRPDPSVFSTESDPVGIQVGTAVATLVRKADHRPARQVEFRHLWGRGKRAELAATGESEPGGLYERIEPVLPLGLPFVPTAMDERWFEWPSLPDLFPVSFPGVKTSRDGFLVDIDLDRLRERVTEYFDSALSHEEITRRYPTVMKSTAGFDARGVREVLLERGLPDESAYVRFAYRPFDTRWLYWEAETELLDRKRIDYKPHAFDGNRWIEARERETQVVFSRGTLVRHLADNFGNGLSSFFPLWLRERGMDHESDVVRRRSNLSCPARRYLDRLGCGEEDLFHYVLAVLHASSYREANVGALRMEWPRIPLPGWPDGTEGAAQALSEIAARGCYLARLLDLDRPVPGVTQGAVHQRLLRIAVPETSGGLDMGGDDFALTAGWGHNGSGDAVMPGHGRLVERAYRPKERESLAAAAGVLGEKTCDVYLNSRTLWRNVPSAVWNYKLGGYQVLKKWLSYREREILGRALTIDEVQHFQDTARRIAEIIRASCWSVPQ